MAQTFEEALAQYQKREGGGSGPSELRDFLHSRGLGTSKQNCSNWLIGSNRPRGKMLGQLADALKLYGADRLTFLDLACKP